MYNVNHVMRRLKLLNNACVDTFGDFVKMDKVWLIESLSDTVPSLLTKSKISRFFTKYFQEEKQHFSLRLIKDN